MGSQEIILNLWYVIDDEGLIYSLRARCYVHSGTDDEKLAFLQSVAETDYLVAQTFEIPERFHTTITNEHGSDKLPGLHTLASGQAFPSPHCSKMQFRKWRNRFQSKRSCESDSSRLFV